MTKESTTDEKKKKQHQITQHVAVSCYGTPQQRKGKCISICADVEVLTWRWPGCAHIVETISLRGSRPCDLPWKPCFIITDTN